MRDEVVKRRNKKRNEREKDVKIHRQKIDKSYCLNKNEDFEGKQKKKTKLFLTDEF